jgi:hypothetical protein
MGAPLALVATRRKICAHVATALSDKRSRFFRRKMGELYCSLYPLNSFGEIAPSFSKPHLARNILLFTASRSDKCGFC